MCLVGISFYPQLRVWAHERSGKVTEMEAWHTPRQGFLSARQICVLLLLNAHCRGWILTMLSFLETAPTPGKLIASDSLHPAEGSRVSLLELKAFLNMDSSSLL